MNTVGDFISGRVVAMTADCKASQAARAMDEAGVGCVMVMEPGRGLVGLVTDRDLTREILCRQVWEDVPLSQIMSREVISVEGGTPIEEAVQLMISHGVRRLPVVNRRHDGSTQCVGLLSFDDLITSRRISAEAVADIIRAQLLWGPRKRISRQRSGRKADQREREFHHSMAAFMNLPLGKAKKVTHSVLSHLLRRVVFGEAADLLSQLPRRVQDPLWQLAPGPDDSINARTLLNEVCRQTGMKEAEARSAVADCWQGLEAFLGEDTSREGELRKLASQLPRDMQELLGVDSASRREAA